MPHRRKILLLGAFAASAVVCASLLAAISWTWLARPPWGRTVPEGPISEAQSRLAFDGVDHKSDWEPVLRRIDGLDMALVPAGCFTMGSTDTQLAEAQDSCDRGSTEPAGAGTTSRPPSSRPMKSASEAPSGSA